MAHEKPFIITVDGKAGVGKSELSEKLIKSVPDILHLTCVHFDTGLFFRAIAFSAHHDGMDLDAMSDCDVMAYLSSKPFRLEFVASEEDVRASVTYLKEIDGEVTELGDDLLRSEQVDFMASKLGNNQIVARWMEEERKTMIMESGIDVVIINGRDTAANYFPEADLKIILDEEERYRARRRTLEKVLSGAKAETEQVRAALLRRDEKDADLLKHNSSLDGVWEIDRSGMSSKRLATLVTQAVGLIIGGGDDLGDMTQNRDLLHESLIQEVETAFSNQVLVQAMLGISGLHRIIQKYDRESGKLFTEIKYIQ